MSHDTQAVSAVLLSPAIGAVPRIPNVGYWIDEDSHARLHRAMSASTLLASVDDKVARLAAISHESMAQTAQYVADDLKRVLAGAVFVTGCRSGDA